MPNQNPKSSRRLKPLLYGLALVASIGFTFSATRLDSLASFIQQITPQTGLTSGLVGHWTMDGDKIAWGTNSVTDSSGSGNNGTMSNMSIADSPARGKLSQALYFDGWDEYVSVTNPAADNFGTGPMSVAMWVKTTDSYTILIDNKTASSNNAGFNLQIDEAGDAYFKIANGSTQWYTPAASNCKINDGNWHHVVGTLTRGTPNDTLKFYVDGVLKQSEPVSQGWNITSNQSLLFASYTTTPTENNFIGSIDDVRLYNRALTDAEVNDLYVMGQ